MSMVFGLHQLVFMLIVNMGLSSAQSSPQQATTFPATPANSDAARTLGERFLDTSPSSSAAVSTQSTGSTEASTQPSTVITAEYSDSDAVVSNRCDQDRPCNESSELTCGNWSQHARCEHGRNFTLCVQANDTILSGEYSAVLPYTSVSYPQLMVPVSSSPQLCYAITQLRLSAASAAPDGVLVDLSVEFDGQTVLFNATGTEPQLLEAFVQVCCHDYQCFDVASLLCSSDSGVQFRGQPFTLRTSIAVSASQCAAPPLPENGVHGCTGDVFDVGTTCVYSCSRGHSVAGGSTVTCQAGTTWSPAPPRCSILTYAVDTSPIQIGETNATGLLEEVTVNITIADALTEQLVVPVSYGSLPITLTPSNGASFVSQRPNQTQEITVTSAGDNQLLDPVISGELVFSRSTGSRQYAGFPVNTVSVDVSVVDSEPYVAEFILSASHQSSVRSFVDSARQVGEVTASSSRNTINDVSSGVRVLTTAESGTASETFSCVGGSQRSGLLQYADRGSFEQLANSAFSIDAWVKMTSASQQSGDQYLFQYSDPGHPSEVSVQFVQSPEGTYDPQLCVSGYCWRCNWQHSVQVNGKTYTASIAENEWHHVVLAKSVPGPATQTLCFVDGARQTTTVSGRGADGRRTSSPLHVCAQANIEFDLLRVVVGNARFSNVSQAPFIPPHRAKHFTCPPLIAPVNGRISCSSYTEGGVCTASCKPGFSLQQSFTAQRICHASGLWSGLETVCIPLVIHATADTLLLSIKPSLTGYPAATRVSVVLGARIDADVEVPLLIDTNSSSPLLEVFPKTVLFSPLNWQIAQIVTVSVRAVDQRRVHSPTEAVSLSIGPANASDQYRGFPLDPGTLSFTWVNSELFAAAFYLFSPWFATDTGFQAHSIAAALQNTTVQPDTVFALRRETNPLVHVPELATTSTIALTQPYYASYRDRDAFRIGSRAFHLDFWASLPSSLSVPVLQYSASSSLRPGISDAAGFSVSLEGKPSSGLVQVVMKVCIAGECAQCSHLGVANEWRHFTVSRDAGGAARCFINGHRVLWNQTLNVWLTRTIAGEPNSFLYVGGELPGSQQTGTAYVELIRLYVNPDPSSLTTLPLLPGELSLLDCGLVTTVGANITCTRSQGLVSDTCHVACRSGRIVDHSETSIRLSCPAGRQWTPSRQPACELDCSPLTITNAVTSCATGFTIPQFRSTCDVTCNAGFQLLGSNGTLFCLSGGMWSDPDVMCVSTQTSPTGSPIR